MFETAKIFRLGRLQHGQGQDEEQATSCGGTGQEPRHRRSHPHAAGSTAEEVILGDQQASGLAFILQGSPSTFPGPPGKHPFLPSSLFCFPLHPQASLALTYRTVVKVKNKKTPFCLYDSGVGWRFTSPPGRSPLCLSATHSPAPSAHSTAPSSDLGFHWSKMHYSGCVCHQAGLGGVC